MGGYKSVFLNPPYSHPLIDGFVDKMVEHNDGIALLFNRIDASFWQDDILPNAGALLFIRRRLKFLLPNGTEAKQGAGCGSVLVSFGAKCSNALMTCNIEGFKIRLKY